MELTVDEANRRAAQCLPGLLGLEFTHLEKGLTRAQMAVRSELLAPHGFLHGGSVVGLADTACGFGALTSLPEGASGFTTLELKSNFLGTAVEGVVMCEAQLSHGGRSTQVWDAVVSDQGSGRTLALFRCTQMILYPS